MDQVVDHLFISSWELAKDLNMLKSNNIKHILNFGCVDNTQFDGIRYLSFPSIMDVPETLLLSVLPASVQFIKDSVCLKENVLVHCVYGQSRSVAIVVMYLVENGMELNTAIDCVGSAHSGICINPGFLQQLYFAAHFDANSPEYRLLSAFANDKSTLLSEETDQMSEKCVLCKACGRLLCRDSERIVSTVDSAAFVATHLDSFWKGYRPLPSSSGGATVVTALPLHGHLVVGPQNWVANQISTSRFQCAANRTANSVELTLRCPQCEAECGVWRHKGLNLIGEHNLCDLIALQKSAVRIKRPRPPEVTDVLVH